MKLKGKLIILCLMIVVATAEEPLSEYTSSSSSLQEDSQFRPQVNAKGKNIIEDTIFNMKENIITYVILLSICVCSVFSLILIIIVYFKFAKQSFVEDINDKYEDGKLQEETDISEYKKIKIDYSEKFAELSNKMDIVAALAIDKIVDKVVDKLKNKSEKGELLFEKSQEKISQTIQQTQAQCGKRNFYVGRFENDSFKESESDDMHKCTTLQNNEAEFELLIPMSKTDLQYFLNSEVNNPKICRFEGIAVSTSDIRTISKGRLVKSGNVWVPIKPFEIQFISK